MIHQEEWREIEGFPLYEVSNLGRIRNAKANQIRKTQLNHQGFPTLVLYNTPDPTRYVRQLNKLVATAFLPQPDTSDMTSVWHLDGDLENCAADNLKWDRRDRVLEWNEMHRVRQPRLRTPDVMDNSSGRVYTSAFECGLAVGDIESAVVAHIERYPDHLADRAKYRYVER